VEFGAGDGMRGVAEKATYVIYACNVLGSLGIPLFPHFSNLYLCFTYFIAGIFFISLSALIMDSFSPAYLVGLIYGTILGLQGALSLHRAMKIRQQQSY
jgi:CHASE2 domain-containing sensor protein